MNTDPLQQLRDVHLPGAIDWWPPAPGWWLLALALLVLLGWLVALAWRWWRSRSAARHAVRLHTRLVGRWQDKAVSDIEYVHAANALLKRLLVHGLITRARDAITVASGREWLELLDQCSGSSEFSEGPGKILGHARFAPEPQMDVPAVQALVAKLLLRLARRPQSHASLQLAVSGHDQPVSS